MAEHLSALPTNRLNETIKFQVEPTSQDLKGVHVGQKW
jgi:hypothetical protein